MSKAYFRKLSFVKPPNRFLSADRLRVRGSMVMTGFGALPFSDAMDGNARGQRRSGSSRNTRRDHGVERTATARVLPLLAAPTPWIFSQRIDCMRSTLWQIPVKALEIPLGRQWPIVTTTGREERTRPTPGLHSPSRQMKGFDPRLGGHLEPSRLHD
jgi:hypothetical protein